MKWIWSTAFVILAAAAALSAQTNESMKTKGATPASYTGCVEAGPDVHSFVLTHVGEGDQMAGHNGMKEEMPAMTKKDGPAMAAEMPPHEMTPGTIGLTTRVDLKKYVGQKVTVTGSLSDSMSPTMASDRGILRVASLKVVAKSCS